MKKVILITGGSRGIGKYLVDSLSSNYQISTCSRSILELETDNLLSVKCDLRKHNDVVCFTGATIRKFGRIDVMIYNAGLILYDDMLDIKEDVIDELYGVTVKGYLFACQEVIPVMRKQGSGHIISISSIRGLSAVPGKSAYSAMKRAAISMTDSVRVENRQYGIKATSLHPAAVDTDSSRERYKGKLGSINFVQEQDILKTIKFLLSLSEHTVVDSIFVDGEL